MRRASVTNKASQLTGGGRATWAAPKPSISKSPPEKGRNQAKRWSNAGIGRLDASLGLTLVVALANAGIGLVGPLRSLFVQSQGASLATIGLMTLAYLTMNLAAQLPSGWLADYWGARQVLLLGLILQAGLSLAYIGVRDPMLFIGLRCGEGFAAAMLIPSARTIAAQTTSSRNQGRTFGLLSGAANVGLLLGPAAGGVLAVAGYSTAFVGAAALRVLAVGVLALSVPPTPPAKSALISNNKKFQPCAYFGGFRTLIRLPLIGSYTLAIGDNLLLGFEMTLMPLWMSEHLGASVLEIGLTYAAWAIPCLIIAPLGGHLVDRHQRRGLVILVFGIAQIPIYAFYGFAGNALLVVFAYSIHSTLYAFFQPAVDAHTAIAAAAVQARAQAAYTAFGTLGCLIGATASIPLYSIDYRFPLIAIGLCYGLCITVGAILILFAEHRSHQSLRALHAQSPHSSTVA